MTYSFDKKENNKENFFCEREGGIGPFRKALEELKPATKEELIRGTMLPKQYFPYYIYFIKEFVATLDRKSQIAYYHFVSDLPKSHTSILVNMTEKQLDRLMEIIYSNAKKFLEEFDVFNKDEEHYDQFLEMLLDSTKDDEEIAEEYGEDLASIKVSRVFALQAKEMMSEED